VDHDELGNAYVTAPDRTVRLGYLPEGRDDALWKIAAYPNPFGPPHWVTTFSDTTPTEIVTGFTSALAEKYAQGRGGYLQESRQVRDGYAPLAAAGWTMHSTFDYVEVTAPDEQAGLVYHRGRTDHMAELFGQQEKWTVWGGPEGYRSRWYGTHSTYTPVSLIAATTAAMADASPVVRSRAEVPDQCWGLVEATPLEPPTPPAPTPLDVRRAQAARARSTASAPSPSTLCYTSSTRQPGQSSSHLPNRRR